MIKIKKKLKTFFNYNKYVLHLNIDSSLIKFLIWMIDIDCFYSIVYNIVQKFQGYILIEILLSFEFSYYTLIFEANKTCLINKTF